MDFAKIVVTTAGLLAILAVIWYFFLGQRKLARAGTGVAGVQEIKVIVKGGYEPDRILVRAGRPVRLHFYRDEAASCSERIVFPDFGVARDLPAFKTTTIELTPANEGEFQFECGMGMMKGKLLVVP